MSDVTSELTVKRFRVLVSITMLLVVAFAGRLGYVQIVSSSDYGEIAAGNRVREETSSALRGRIFDMNGVMLAGNRKSFAITLDWQPLANLDSSERSAVFSELVAVLPSGVETSEEQLERLYERAQQQGLRQVTVAEDIDVETWLLLSEMQLVGVDVQTVPLRTYVDGSVAAHTIGYLGNVVDQSEADHLNRVSGVEKYRPGALVGRSGIESFFEYQLSGVPETRLVEIDSKNRFVRVASVRQEAVPGADLYLTIDIRLQRIAERALVQQLERARSRGLPAGAGSVVILDPLSGSVRALASYPTFDPADFVFGLDPESKEALETDINRPFLNRAIQGQYSPGSTFKPVTAYASLELSVRESDEIWTDEGTYQLQSCADQNSCTVQNAKGAVMGDLDLAGALTRSSDTYFYSLGETLWLNRDRYGDTPIQQTAEKFGFGRQTGLELAGESDGLIPGPEQRAELNEKNPGAFPDPGWYAGDNVNLSIGQGELLATPVQIANMYSTLANDGTRFETRLVEKVVSAGGQTNFGPRRASQGEFEDELLVSITDGLVEVTETGTAAGTFRTFPRNRFEIASKTGTVEVQNKEDYSLFAGYISPSSGGGTLAFSIVLEESGFGSETAAVVARQIFTQYDKVGGFKPAK